MKYWRKQAGSFVLRFFESMANKDGVEPDKYWGVVLILTCVPLSQWRRVSLFLQGDCDQIQWFLCWPGKIHWTAWFLGKVQSVGSAMNQHDVGMSTEAQCHKIRTWYLDRTLTARLDPVDLVIPQHLVQRRPLEERQHHLWPGILCSQVLVIQLVELHVSKLFF